MGMVIPTNLVGTVYFDKSCIYEAMMTSVLLTVSVIMSLADLRHTMC